MVSILGYLVNEIKEKGAPDRSTFRYKEGLLSIFIFLDNGSVTFNIKKFNRLFVSAKSCE